MSARARGRKQARRAAHAQALRLEHGWSAEDQEMMEGLLAGAGTDIAADRALTEREAVEAIARALAMPDMTPREELPAPNPSPAEAVPEQPTRSDVMVTRWEAIFAPEGVLTDDGRALAPGSTSWRDLPLTLMAMIETTEGGHIGAEIAGRIDEIHRDGRLIKASGIFDSGEYAQGIERMVGDQTLKGLSVDLAIADIRFVDRSLFFDAEGDIVPDWQERLAAPEEERDILDILFGTEENLVALVTDSVIGMATVCPFPAFAGAEIHLVAAGHRTLRMTVPLISFQVTEETMTADEHEAFVASLSASAVLGQAGVADQAIRDSAGYLTAAAAGMAPIQPPSEWFEDPGFEELTALTVDEQGHVFGHAASWDTCHIGIPGVCTTAPTSETDYAFFHLKEVECDDGARVPVGTVTLDTGHANERLRRADATAHYDHTGTAAADVRVGEDEFGIWVSGALRPDMDAERVRDLRAATLSGDWRNVDGNLELVALLAVNVPGFPVPRTPSGMVAALVAAGVVQKPVLAADEIDEIVGLVERAEGA